MQRALLYGCMVAAERQTMRYTICTLGKGELLPLLLEQEIVGVVEQVKKV